MKKCKIICLLIMISLLLSNFISIPETYSNNEPVTVIVTTNLINKESEYIIKFPLKQPIETGGWIKVIFPYDTTLPVIIPRTERGDSGEEYEVDVWQNFARTISVGMPPVKCSKDSGLPEINYKERSIKIYLNNPLYSNNYTYIFFSKYTGIKNASKPGAYTLKISTSAEPEIKESLPYNIAESELSGPNGYPEVEVEPSEFGAVASYKIRFKLESQIGLTKDLDLITINFPYGIELPSKTISSFSSFSLTRGSIKLNGKVANYYVSSNNNLVITTPVNLESGTVVLIEIPKSFGIRNTILPGEKNLIIQVSRKKLYSEAPFIKTKTFFIRNGDAPLNIYPQTISKEAQYIFTTFLEDNEIISPENPMYLLIPESLKISRSFSVYFRFIRYSQEKLVYATYKINNNVITVYPKESISFNSSFKSTLKVCVQYFVNPESPQEIKLGYKIGEGQNWKYTREVQIEERKFKINTIGFNSQEADSVTGYSINFTLGPEKGLNPDDSIFIRFPESTYIPQKINPLIVGLSSTEFKGILHPELINVIGSKLEIKLNREIKPDSSISINIGSEAGFKNPIESDKYYRIFLSTSKEEEVPSEEFYIFPKRVIYEIKPVIKDGKIGKESWYISPPVLTFETQDPDARIFFYLNTFIPYTEPIYFDGGQYKAKISFFSQSDLPTTGDNNVLEVWVDTIKPQIKIKKPEKSKVTTMSDNYKIEGSIVLPKTIYYGSELSLIDQVLTINNKGIEFCGKDGSFNYNLKLNRGKNQVKILAEDIAGNTGEMNLEIWLGYSITLKINSNKAIVNEEEVSVDPPFISNGRTYVPLRFFEIIGAKITYTEDQKTGAVKTITLELGQTKIILTVGSNRAVVNGKEVKLDSPPLIVKGRTFIPLRFVAENLGANVTYIKEEQKILISYYD